jgi:hypothetical protein
MAYHAQVPRLHEHPQAREPGPTQAPPGSAPRPPAEDAATVPRVLRPPASRPVGPRCWACQLDYAPEPALDIRDYLYRAPDREIV